MGTYSIVTGNGFTGNAQRGVGSPGIYSNNGFVFNSANNYVLSFKYRSNTQLYICDSAGVDLQIGYFSKNTGNAAYTSVNMFNATYLNGKALGIANNTFAYNATSSSTITTSDSSISLTTQTGLPWKAGDLISIGLVHSHLFNGTKVSYNSGTGDLVIGWTSNSGTGTFSYWQVFNIPGGFVNYSSTTAAIPTGAGNTTLNIGAGQTVAANVQIVVDPTVYVNGSVTSYDPSTGAMVVSRSSSGNVATSNDWALSFNDTTWFEIDEVYLYTV